MSHDDTAGRATWAVVLGLLTTAAAGAGCAASPFTTGCPDQTFPAGDPCFGKGGCDQVPASDAGPDDAGVVPMRFCGCCNG